MSNALSKSLHQPDISCSDERGTFQRDHYLKKALADGKLETDPEVVAMLAAYDLRADSDTSRWLDPARREHDLEFDLRSTQWILEKARGDEVYAQHIYAALCNTDWQRNEVWPILKNEKWSCSWRYAGGIVADMRKEGDYIDWYSSGIRPWDDEPDPAWLANATEEQVRHMKQKQAYVPEGTVTDEISKDFLKLGWQCVFSENNN